MKCAICSKKIEETFMKKIVGTYIYDKKKKKQLICFECQKKFPRKEEILKELS